MNTEIFTPKRANDYFAPRKRFRPPRMLFDEFWREGELALMFGAASSGKSIFAVQLADAMARGTPMLGFRMPRGARSVLYVDLRNTDEQFTARCSWRPEGQPRNRRLHHNFPKNMFRDRPRPGEDLCEWVRKYVTKTRTRVVIIDDLAAVKKTHDGTRETLALMRELRVLRDELGISILVITDALPSKGNYVSESDMGRSRVLCTVADSVFAIGRNISRIGDRYLLQTRSKSTPLYWTEKNAPRAVLGRVPSGLLVFEFDERFSEAMPEEKRRLICEVNKLHIDGEKTFREIAAELGISSSWAHKLYQKWTPAMASSEQSAVSSQPEEEGEYEYEDEYWDETEISAEASEWIEEEAYSGSPPYEGGVRLQPGGGSLVGEDGEPPRQPKQLPPLLCNEGSFLRNPAEIPFAAGLGRRSIYDLEYGLDSYGREIYVESREEHSGKPTVWYQLDRLGTTRRFKRGTFGIEVEHLNTGPFL